MKSIYCYFGLLIPCVFLFFLLKKESGENIKLGNFPIEMSFQSENTITFILGEDTEEDNPYYREAEKFYRFHEEEKTEEVISHCRSLIEMRNYLEENAPSNGEAWAKINVVVHSNQWRGLGAPIFKDGKRTTTGLLRLAIKQGKFPPLPSNIVNKKTSINFQSCGLGNHTEMLYLLQEAFSKKALVRSSNYFVFYHSKTERPLEVEKYLSEYWFAFHKTGYRPGDIKLGEQLEQLNRGNGVDWRDALSRKKPRFPGDTYHYNFNIPVNWVVTYPNEAERPKISTKQEETQWLDKQEELKNALNQYGIPMDQFRWKFEQVAYTFEDGTIEPAIVASGKTTIVCVLRSMAEKSKEGLYQPLRPDENDCNYYGVVK